MIDRRVERTCIDCPKPIQVVFVCSKHEFARMARHREKWWEQLMADVRTLYPEMEVDGRKRQVKEEAEDVAEGMLL